MSPEKLLGIQERSRWSKAEKSIRKALAKDSLNPEPAYLLALYYFHPSFSTFNVDSASAFQHRAVRLTGFHDRGRKPVPDTVSLRRLRVRIDSAAFERAKEVDSEEGYQFFLDRFGLAAQRPVAIELRDEMAFLKALKGNTSGSFQAFITRYPASHRRQEAQDRMDKLLYEEETKDRRLSGYVRFYDTYRDSPFRSLAEKNIFEISTASGEHQAFQRFLDRYPQSKWSGRARTVLFEMLQAGILSEAHAPWMTDSLRQQEKLNDSYWVAVRKAGRYGFIDENGTEIVAPRFENIPEEYRCGGIRDRFLITSQGLLARNGSIFWPGNISESRELGLGFVLIASDSGRVVVHEAGFRVGPDGLQDALIIANRFVGLKKNGKWAIFSLVGRPLLPFGFDEVATLDSLIQLTKNRKRILTTPGRIGRIAEGSDFREDFVFDETRKWGEQHYWVRNGVLEGVVDANLNFLIPLDRQLLRKTSFGFLSTKSDRMFIRGIRHLEDIPYRSVTEQAGWIRMKDASSRNFLYDKGFGWKKEGDSVWFQGQIAFLQSVDSVTAFLPSGQKVSFARGATYQLKEYRDVAAWIILEEKKRKWVVDAESGVRLFGAEFDNLDPVSGSVFILTRGNKRGLMQDNGKVLLPLEYDAIVPAEDDSYSLLKEKKFGWYDARSNVLIKPIYDRNVRPYNKTFRLAYKEGGYGFIHPDGKLVGNYSWEDVQYWNDSVAWVKKSGQWQLVEIQTQRTKLDRIRKFTHISDSPLEKITLVQQDHAYGVISSTRGVVVPIQYTDVLNLGSKEVPLYFTERHIAEAGISVVVYFDRHGKVVRTQAMETDEFEKIACGN